MFVGHYGPSFGLRHVSGGVPLWVLFVAAQLTDILWAVLVMTGVEKLRIVPGFTASSPLDLYYMPYTHSLTASLAWAAAFGVLAGWIWGRRGGLVVALCVVAHWFLDLPVHVADLPLWGDSHKVGLGLWNHRLAALGLEAGVLFLGTAVYARQARVKAPIWAFSIVMLAIQMTSFVAPPPPEPGQFAAMALFSYLFFAVGAWFVEKRWGPGESFVLPRGSLSARRFS